MQPKITDGGAGHPARGNDLEPIPSCDTKIALSRHARVGWPAPQLPVCQFFLTTRVSAVLLIATFNSWSPAFAQNNNSGAISGSVVDTSGTPIARVIIRLTNVSTGVPKPGTRTSRNGTYF